MAYPVTYRKLFESDGAGPKLRQDILPSVPEANLPATYVKASASQSLTDGQKLQARTNIDAQSATELTTALSELITEYGGTVPS